MTVPTVLRLFSCAVLLVLLPVNDAQSSICAQTTSGGLRGSIASPNYPYSYGNSQTCYNYINASSLSTITITFNALGLEQQASCAYDWLEFTCWSNSIRRPVRYCGSGYRAQLIINPCSRVLVRFYSDGVVTGYGFSVSYDIQPIRCQGNCTPVASGSGYNCSCDANQTPYIAPPYNQCPTGCTDSSTYCACSSVQAIPPSSTTTTTTLPPTTTTTTTTLPSTTRTTTTTLPTTTTTSYSACGPISISGLRGNITSPNYPYSYGISQSCSYNIVAPSLSTITITFNALGLEQHATCGYDWIEFTCASNSISRPDRYCGSGYRAPLTFKPCSRVSVRFYSDGVITGSGFLVTFDIEPIRCQGNCTPVASGAGYNCSCEANQTPYIAPPYNQCPIGCTDSSTYCACSSDQAIPPASTTTTTTLPTTTTTSYSAGCRHISISNLRGNITSPNYPNLYGVYQSCYENIHAPVLSTITITFNAFGLEQHATCTYDWIEFTCASNSISRPVRYCGSGYRAPLSFKPCTLVSMTFFSDGFVSGPGFSVSYDSEPISCQSNCAPVAIGAGYNCTCDANQTPFIAPPYNQCPTGCSDSSTYCACSSPQTIPPASTTTNTTATTLPPTPTTSYSACRQSTISGLRGSITSPYYPNNYENSQSCNNYIDAPSLSTITITFNALGLEPHYDCAYDRIEFTCASNSISRLLRYCGSGYRSPLSFKLCSRVSVRFSSDGAATGSGFSVSYDIEPISCQGNCTPVATGAGYNCTCDANQTSYIAPPNNQCPIGCYDSLTYCSCSTPHTNTSASTTTTTTLPPTTTTTTTTLPPTTTTSYSACGQGTFSGLTGNITSPNYPYLYENNQHCSYVIVASSLSTINLTFDAFDIEQSSTCYYDWIEFACESNSTSRPVRYCGYGYRAELSFMPCTRVLMTFSSDSSVTGTGFSVSYDIEPISCQGNCTPVASGAGYNCTCDANQTFFIAPLDTQCADGCSDSSTYCACSQPPTDPNTSEFTTAFEWYNPENDTESSSSPPSAMPDPDDTTTS